MYVILTHALNQRNYNLRYKVNNSDDRLFFKNKGWREVVVHYLKLFIPVDLYNCFCHFLLSSFFFLVFVIFSYAHSQCL